MSRAHRAVGVGVVEGGLDPLEPEGELAADVDEGLRHLQGVGGDEHALDELVGVALDQQVVLEGGRLALVAVDHQVGDRVLAQHGPLAAGREAGTAPAQEAGRVHLVGHRLGGHGQGLAQAVVAAGGQVALEGMGVVMDEPGGDDPRRVGEGHSRGRARAPSGRVLAPRPPRVGLGLGHGRPLAPPPRAGSAPQPGGAGAPGSACRAGGSRRRGRRRAARRSGDRRSPGVWAPTKRWLTWTHGARSQSARHSASSRVIAPSAVVPPLLTPRRRLGVLEELQRPVSRQAMLVHTATTCVPDRLGCAACRRTRPCPAPRPGSRRPARRCRPWPRG